MMPRSCSRPATRSARTRRQERVLRRRRPGMVVGVDGAGDVRAAGPTVRAQQACSGVYRVGGVIGARGIRASGRHGLVVRAEGGRLELHRTLCPRVDSRKLGGTVGGLDCADCREHTPGQARAGQGGTFVEGEHLRGHAAHRRGARQRAGAKRRADRTEPAQDGVRAQCYDTERHAEDRSADQDDGEGYEAQR